MVPRPFRVPLIAAAVSIVTAFGAFAGDSLSRPRGSDRSPATTTTRPIDSERLVRLFRTGRDPAKLAALHEAARTSRDDPQFADALWQIIRPAREGKGITASLLAAVRVYSELPSAPHAERQLALLSAGDSRVVLEAADGLATRKAPEALAPIGALRQHREYARRYAFRHRVLSAVAQYDEPAAIEWLIETVASSEGQLKYDAARHLARLTGENFGGQGAQWRDWWASHRLEFAQRPVDSPARPSSMPLLDIPWDEPVPTFFNVPVYARRVVFVVDRSKSMASSVDSVTRLDDAQRELERAVRGLPDKTHFNLVAYDDSLRLWRDRLVPATLQNKSESLRFIYALYPDKRTACYDALESALASDPDLEQIVFLSDGEPNAGKIVDPGRIVQEITSRNAAAHVRIDVLGLDAGGRSEEFLRTLAESNGGTYRGVR